MPFDCNDAFQSVLAANARELDVSLSATQLRQMHAHFRLLLEANQKFNLTRITESVAAAAKHYADSIALAAWCNRTGQTPATLLDIGTGAGFPSVPLAIARPDWQICALEATRKKADFVRTAANELRLTNLTITQCHSSQWRTAARFDLVVSRAVAKLGTFVRSAARFAGGSGFVVCYKSSAIAEYERQDGQRAAQSAGLHVWPGFDYELRVAGATLSRSLFVYARRPAGSG